MHPTIWQIRLIAKLAVLFMITYAGIMSLYSANIPGFIGCTGIILMIGMSLSPKSSNSGKMAVVGFLLISIAAVLKLAT